MTARLTCHGGAECVTGSALLLAMLQEALEGRRAPPATGFAVVSY